MFGLRKALSPIILAAAFIALASLASYLYNSDQAKQADIKNSSALQKGKAVLDVVLDTSENMADSNVDRSTGFGDKLVDAGKNFILKTDWKGMISGEKTVKDGLSENIMNYSSSSSTTTDNAINNVKDIATEITSSAAPVLDPNNQASGFFSKFITSIKAEWEKMRSEAEYEE